MLGASVERTQEISPDDVLQAHRERLEQAGELGFAISQNEVPVDRGTLKQSGFPPEFREDDLVFGYTADYAEPMEKGTDPFQPPIQPLLEWSQRVNGDTGLGYYVATQKIPEEGIDAQPYLAPAAERMQTWLDNNGLDL
jgi:hypothetical protein